MIYEINVHTRCVDTCILVTQHCSGHSALAYTLIGETRAHSHSGHCMRACHVDCDVVMHNNNNNQNSSLNEYRIELLLLVMMVIW